MNLKQDIRKWLADAIEILEDDNTPEDYAEALRKLKLVHMALDNPPCPTCYAPMMARQFVDSWGPDKEPEDINEDWYCVNCKQRWASTPPPHHFFEDAGGS